MGRGLFVVFLSPMGEADGSYINSTFWVLSTHHFFFFFTSLTSSRVNMFYPGYTYADMNSIKCKEGFIIL